MTRRRDKTEQRWQGIAVSDGTATGRVLRIHSGGRHSIYRVSMDASGLEREVRRYRAAVRLARRQLLALKKRAARTLGEEHAYIFDAHLLMLEDRKLNEDVEAVIRAESVGSEWAVKVVTDRLLAVYDEIKDDYLRERSSDIEDVTRRLLVALSGESMHGRRLTEDAVIVAEELMPSTLAELDFAHVKAVATDVGGWTSHTAIIARGLGIPAVVGLRDFYRTARTGDTVVIDAGRGEVVLHPGPETLERFGDERRAARASATPAAAAEDLRAPLRTLDGVEVTLRANVELPVEYEWVNRFGARGIGLFRSEFLLSHRGSMPNEDEQCAAYEELARVAGDEGVTVRLFDLGGDKLPGSRLDPGEERNPALGLRAIRFCLQHPDILRTQARAVLRAAARARIDLVLPMVSDVTDVRRARAVIEGERARLKAEGREAGPLRVGAMIEVPSAVIVAESLAREVDFFSLGTNDLVQYTLAVDRGNDEVAGWFRTLHPAVLTSVRRALDAARAAGIPSVVCGEMAGSPAYAAVLLGLGARELSMAPASIPRVRRAIEGIEEKSVVEIADACLECADADEVEELVRAGLGGRWPNLFPPEILPPPKSKG